MAVNAPLNSPAYQRQKAQNAPQAPVGTGSPAPTMQRAPAGTPLPPPSGWRGYGNPQGYNPRAFGPGPGPSIQAPSVPHPDVVMGLVFALIVVNGFSSGQFSKIWNTLIGNTGATKHDFLILGGEFAFAVGLSMIAGTSPGASKVILALVLALWLLWGVQNVQHIQNFTKKASIKG